MNTQNIFPISQRDPEWTNTRVGHSQLTIGDHGSLLICFAMLAGTDPVQMNQQRLHHSGYGDPAWQSAKAVSFDISHETHELSGYGLRVAHNSGLYQRLPFPDEELAQLLNHLANGQPAIIETDVVPLGSQAEQHFVVGVGLADGQIKILDPWDGMQRDLLPTYGCRNNRVIVRTVLYEMSIEPVERLETSLMTRVNGNRYTQE